MIRTRLAPFIALLDARYLPLLFAVAPQAWAVYAWLIASQAPVAIAALGAVGYEAVYIAAVAWAEYGGGDVWAQRRTALAALLFSIAVAVYYYWPMQGWGALLHAGFPLVAYFLTLQMHTSAPHLQQSTAEGAADASHIVQAVQVNVDARPHDAAHTAAPVLSAPAYACRKCGGALASPQAVAASARWGCEACKQPAAGRTRITNERSS